MPYLCLALNCDLNPVGPGCVYIFAGEQRDATMTGDYCYCRDNQQQQHTQACLQQSKVNARAAISGLAQQEEQQKALRKQLIRARADYEELLEDGKQACLCNTMQLCSAT